MTFNRVFQKYGPAEKQNKRGGRPKTIEIKGFKLKVGDIQAAVKQLDSKSSDTSNSQDGLKSKEQP